MGFGSLRSIISSSEKEGREAAVTSQEVSSEIIGEDAEIHVGLHSRSGSVEA